MPGSPAGIPRHHLASVQPQCVPQLALLKQPGTLPYLSDSFNAALAPSKSPSAYSAEPGGRCVGRPLTGVGG